MPHKTDIEWCSHSSNPLRAEFNGKRGWSCEKLSPGCLNCYSATFNGRLGTGLDFTHRDNAKATNYLEEKEVQHILKFRPKPPYSTGRERPSVFVCDMTDLFGDWVADETIDKIFAAFALRSDVDWLLLTKRAERMHGYMTRWVTESDPSGEWRNPLPNVCLGVSAEDQQRADERIPWLLKTPAAVRFVSAEPLLGPIDFGFEPHPGMATMAEIEAWERKRIDWVIVGGESGAGARPCNVAWIRQIVQECGRSDAACFVKQVGSQPVATGASRGDYRETDDLRTLWRMKDKKGGDPAEWPDDLRVRQFPATEAATT